MAEKPVIPGSIEDPTTDLPGPDPEVTDLAEDDFFADDTRADDPPLESTKQGEGTPAAPIEGAPAPAAPAKPGETPAELAAPTPPLPTEPAAAAPSDPAKPAEVPAAELPVSGPTAADIKAAKDSFLAGLEPQYTFTSEEAEQLAVEPQVILPKLAARVHAAVFEDVYRTFATQLPQLVMGVLDGQNRIKEAQDSFYGEWPELKGKEETVARVGQVYHQMYPTATTEQRRKAIGAIAMAELGLTRGAALPPAPAASQPARPPVPHRPRAAGITAPAIPQAHTDVRPEEMWASLIPD